MKEKYMRFRCDEDFKSLIETLAARDNRNFSNYITNLLKGEIKKMKNAGKEVLSKAKSLNHFEISLPEVEIGELMELNDIWDGEGNLPESSYSYLLTNDGMDSEGNCPVWINYVFEIVEKKEEPLKTVIKIIDIELL